MSSFEWSSDNRRQYEQLLSKVRNTLGLVNNHQHTEVSSVMHSRPDVQMEGTFGRMDSHTVQYDMDDDNPYDPQDKYKRISRRVDVDVSSSRESVTKNKTYALKKNIDTKENSRALENCSIEVTRQQDSKPNYYLPTNPMRLVENCQPSVSHLAQSIEVRSLRNQLERSKDKELQMRLQCERLNKEITKMHTEKEMLYREFERKCHEFVEISNTNNGQTQKIGKQSKNKEQSLQIINLTSELKEARFIIEQLKLEASRSDYLQARQPVHTKITQLEERVATLLHDKFRLEEKVEYQQRLLSESSIKSALFASDSRIQTLRHGVQFWIKKSRKVEEEAYKAINGLRLDCEQLKKDLLQRNKQAQIELKTQLKRIQNLKEQSVMNVSAIPSREPIKQQSIHKASSKKVKVRSNSCNTQKYPTQNRLHCR